MKFNKLKKVVATALSALMISSSLILSGFDSAYASPSDEALGNVQEISADSVQVNADDAGANDAETINSSNDISEAEEEFGDISVNQVEPASKTAGKNGWVSEGGAWYYYKNGVKARGWLKLDTRTYYLLNTNKMADNMWRKIKGKLYFFRPGGIMAQDITLNINGVSFTFGSDGQVTSRTTPVIKAGSQAEIQKVINLAKAQLGKRYVWGATGPNTFDCSGLTSYVYKNAAGINIPRVSRDQGRAGTYVSRENLQPGDLVFFGRGNYISHVGMYIGGNKYIHAPQPGDVVKISSLNGVRTITQRRFIQSKNGFVKENGNYVFYNNDKKVYSSWVEDGGFRYYMDLNGNMAAKKWININGDKYYVNRSGIMLKNITTQIGGQRHTFDSSGKLVNK